MATLRKVIASSLAATAAACSCALLGGCLESDAIVEKIIDQNAEEIDYDNPQKNYVLDPTSTITVKDIVDKTNMTADEVLEILYDKAVYSDEPNTDSEAEKGTESDANNSETSADEDRLDEDASNTKPSGSKPSSNKGTGQASDDKGSTAGNGTAGDNDSSAGESDSSPIYSQFGSLEKLPQDVGTVCAVGEAATIALAIGGDGALAGSSSAYLQGSAHRVLFAARGIASAKTCWDDDGLDKGEAKVSAIIKAKPDAVLVESGTSTLTKAEQAQILDAGIQVIVLPALNSDTNIRRAVTVAGHLFSDETNGASEKAAESYKDYVDATLKAAQKAHGGGVVTYGATDFDDVDGTTKRSDAKNPEHWTVFINGWDSSVSASAKFHGKTVVSQSGIAYCQVGWRTSPLSYYMGCGGALNNAAAYGLVVNSNGMRPFLTFNENEVRYTWNSKSKLFTVSDKGTFSQGGNYVLSNAFDSIGTGESAEHHLGSSDFDRVFVGNKETKAALEKARGKGGSTPSSFYSPGSYLTSSVSGYGFSIGGKILPTFSVVADAERDDVLYDIVVNPCGMGGSWAEGSMESFLEAPWIASQYYGEKYSQEQVEEDVREFYKEFYGYELSKAELKQILDGSYA